MTKDDVRVGVELPSNPDPDSIRGSLRSYAEAGFNHVEFCLDIVPLILGGEVMPEYVDYMAGIFQAFPFSYSAHIGGGLNLRLEDGHELHRKALSSSIEVCQRLHMSPLVLHYECQSKDLMAETRFRDAHRWAADLAAEKGVLLCLENIEVEQMEPVVRFVEELAHPNLRMTIDVGHAFLAANYFHFDFLDAIRLAMPLAAHMHLSGNTGDFEELRITNRPVYDSLSKGQRFTFGRGDIHAPPLWGRIPYDEVLRIARDYRGVFLCEYYTQFFKPFLADTQKRVREAVLKARR